MISRFAIGAAVLFLLADVAIGRAQELPSGGGTMPELRRGANGQIEAVTTIPATRQAPRSTSTAPAAPPPNFSSPNRSRGGTAPAVRAAAPPPVPAGPPRPVIEVRPNTPSVPDTAPGGTVVAAYSVRMSDNSPFTGIVRFGPPHYDNNGRFALRDNHIIVNPNGPGIGPNKATVVDHVTLEAIPEGQVGR
jgi:hypothetical protein